MMAGRAPLLAVMLAALPIPAASAPRPADDEIAVTAGRLSRGMVRAQAQDFVRKALADTRSGQNARWNRPVCVQAIGVTGAAAQLFTGRVADVARHVGLTMAGPGCTPNLLLVFTPDAAGLIKTIARRNGASLEGLTGAERALLKRPELPVRWWHHTWVEASDGRQLAPVGIGGVGSGAQGNVRFNNNARGSRIDERMRVTISGAVVVVDINRLGTASPAALSDYVALVSLSRMRLDGPGQPDPSIMQLFAAGRRLTGFTAQDELFIESLYRTPDSVTGAQQRAAMAGYMANQATGTDTGTPNGASGGTDSGRPDSGRPDSGRPESGRPDSGRPESGRPPQ